MKSIDHFRTFLALLGRDLQALRKTLYDTIIDSSIIIFFTYLVYGHLLPTMGMTTTLIPSIFLGIVILVLVNITYDRALRDATDFELFHYIDYQLTLPISMNWLLAKYVTSYSIDLIIASTPMFLLGRIIFGQFLDLSHGNMWLFIITYMLVILTLSTSMLLEAFFVSFAWFRENTFARLLMPSLLLGCIYYPWREATLNVPWLSPFLLISPITYMVEGLRSSLIGTPEFLSVWICIPVLTGIFIINLILLKHVAHKRIDAIQE